MGVLEQKCYSSERYMVRKGVLVVYRSVEILKECVKVDGRSIVLKETMEHYCQIY